MNRRSPLSPSGSVSSCGASPVPLCANWNFKPSPLSPANTFSCNGYSSIYDGGDDDIFGSADWRKKRGKQCDKVGHENRNSNLNQGRLLFKDKAQLSVLKVIAKRICQVCDHVTAAKLWMITMYKRKISSKGVASAGGVGQNGQAIPTANGSPTMSPVTAYDLSDEVLVQQARVLVSGYIHQRLSGKGLLGRRVEVSPASSALAEEVIAAGQELERLYPRVYSDVSRRICMTMSSAQLVRRALTSVLEGTFRSGVTWAKVVSMVVTAAAFAEECVVQGHPNFVPDVVVCVGHFVSINLTGWLAAHGGWNGFPTSRPHVMEKVAVTSPLIFISVFVAALSVVILFISRLLLDVT